jgi:hypothetical protein
MDLAKARLVGVFRHSFRTAAVADLEAETGIVVNPADLVPFASFSDPVDHRLVYPQGDKIPSFALCVADEEARPVERGGHRASMGLAAFVDSGEFQAD